MGRERMNPAIFGHVQNEPSHTRHHRSSRKEFYWICIDQSKNSRELNNGFSCWWILFFAFFHSLHRSLIMKRWCQNHQQMRSERRTPHHWIRNEIPKIKLNWQVFYLRIKITSKILQMELKRLEIFISFHFIIFNEFFSGSEHRVEWSDIKRFKQAMACREFFSLILNGAARWYNSGWLFVSMKDRDRIWIQNEMDGIKPATCFKTWQV